MKEDEEVAKTIVRENETIEEALKRFKRGSFETASLLEARKREHLPGAERREENENAPPKHARRSR